MVDGRQTVGAEVDTDEARPLAERLRRDLRDPVEAEVGRGQRLDAGLRQQRAVEQFQTVAAGVQRDGVGRQVDGQRSQLDVGTRHEDAVTTSGIIVELLRLSARARSGTLDVRASTETHQRDDDTSQRQRVNRHRHTSINNITC